MTAATVFIVNPTSAAGATGKRWREVSARMGQAGVAHEAVFTRGPGDATQVAAQALTDGAITIVAVGGDGTLNEVANGFFVGGDRGRFPEDA